MAIYPKSETDIRVSPDALLSATTQIFSRCGMEEADASLLAETLVHSDRRGVHSHGVLRIPDYVTKLTEEGVDPRGRPRIAKSSRAAIVVDGGNSMGQIGGTFAMDLAIAAAREYGLAFAALGGSNHCGALDWYTLRAVRQGMIGFAGTNALPTMAPVGGKDKIIGINPLSIAIPAERNEPFVLDFAFGATAHGKIRVYHQKNQSIPAGWALDSDGRPTTDPGKALDGLIQPIGGHKGVGLGMAIGMLSSLLSGAAYGTELGNMIDGPRPGHDGQFFVAIDIGSFVDPSEFRHRVDSVIDEVHASSATAGVTRLYVPGEMEFEMEKETARNGISLPGETVRLIRETALRLGLDRDLL